MVSPARMTATSTSLRPSCPSGPVSSERTVRSATSSPDPGSSRSSRISTEAEESVARPSNRPAAPDEVMTESAPLSRRRWTFSVSRTAEAIFASRFSSRAVRVVRTDASSRSGATTTAVARSMPA